MKELSSNAKDCIDNYMQKVRSRLQGAKALDTDDIERDIQEHIEREIEHETEPVGYTVVADVLDRLGAPEQLVPDEELSWWRKILSRMQNGPDDWRLSYICFALFVVGILAPTLWLFFFLPLSAYIARVTISTAGESEKLEAQKKLLYPPLATFYWIAGMTIFWWPSALLLPNLVFPKRYDSILSMGVYLTLTGLWLCIVSGFIQRKQLLEKAIYPFANDARRKDLKGMFRFGMTSLVIGGITLVLNICSNL